MVYSYKHLYIYTFIHVFTSTWPTTMKVAIFAPKYSHTNICVQKQQLSLAGFSTIKLPMSYHKNRFNPDICNFIADYGVKSYFYICLRLLLSINQWIVHIEIGIWNLHGCNHHGFVLVGEAVLQAGFIGWNKIANLYPLTTTQTRKFTSLRKPYMYICRNKLVY